MSQYVVVIRNFFNEDDRVESLEEAIVYSKTIAERTGGNVDVLKVVGSASVDTVGSYKITDFKTIDHEANILEELRRISYDILDRERFINKLSVVIMALMSIVGASAIILVLLDTIINHANAV